MRLVYLGLPLGAVFLARHGFAPDAVLLGHPEALGTRRLRRTLPRSLVLGRPDLSDPRIVDTLAKLEPDLLLSFFWPRKVPAHVLSLPRLGAFGTHPSLLPRHRGADPYFWTIRGGDTETGVCLHRLESEYDTGDVVATSRLAIDPAWNSWTLARRLDRHAIGLLLEAARRAKAGASLDGVPQDHGAASYAPTPTEDDLSIDWREDAASIVRLVRAAAPTPGAIAEVEDRTVEVVDAVEFEGDVPRALEVAEAFVVDGSVVVRAGRGAVRIAATRDEDGAPFSLVDHVRAARAHHDS